jgi:hypothetical protein
MSARVLLLGLDPALVPGFDPAPVQLAIRKGQARFDAEGITVDPCLVPPDESARPLIVEQLVGKDYEVVVIGGGIRKEESLLEMFEWVINLVRKHAPRAKIAFNRNPMDSVDAAKRWLTAR